MRLHQYTRSILPFVLVGCSLTSLFGDIYIYRAVGTLDFVSGNDLSGLDGAQFALEALFDDSEPYLDRFGLPATIATRANTTITGAGVEGNNGTYEIRDGVAFYPTYSGIYCEPQGLLDISLVLSGSNTTLDFGFRTVTTESGGLARIGGLPVMSDFGPSVVISPSFNFDTEFFADNGASYNLLDSRVAVSLLTLGDINLDGEFSLLDVAPICRSLD